MCEKFKNVDVVDPLRTPKTYNLKLYLCYTYLTTLNHIIVFLGMFQLREKKIC